MFFLELRIEGLYLLLFIKKLNEMENKWIIFVDSMSYLRMSLKRRVSHFMIRLFRRRFSVVRSTVSLICCIISMRNLMHIFFFREPNRASSFLNASTVFLTFSIDITRNFPFVFNFTNLFRNIAFWTIWGIRRRLVRQIQLGDWLKWGYAAWLIRTRLLNSMVYSIRFKFESNRSLSFYLKWKT